MDITYDYYRVFYYVARYGSFSRAAEALLKGQPNITKIINNLESQLGCKLFIRSNKGITLTPEGEKLYRHAEIAFENLEYAEEQIISERNLKGGLISIAATEYGLYGSLLSALTDFNRDFGGVKIRLANFNSPQSLEAVKNGVADFAVVTLHEKTDDIFRATKIRDFREILCCKKGYQYDRNNIFASPLISVNRSSYTYKHFREYLLSLGVHKEPDIEVATADQVLPLIKSGMGIGFVSEFMINESLANGEIEEIPLNILPLNRSICLVEDKSKGLSLAAKKLKEYICK
ncbi:MAG: LysR family transcriptional regulator [Clostridia bacterium]|nr:LysR family transcriptional regulator [Clostridia bacterium]